VKCVGCVHALAQDVVAEARANQLQSSWIKSPSKVINQRTLTKVRHSDSSRWGQFASANVIWLRQRQTHFVRNALYPIYVRGEAYLAVHKGKETAAEFQKILDHRGVVLNGPIGALTRLQIARTYVLQGDTAKAKAAYQDFLTRRSENPRARRLGSD